VQLKVFLATLLRRWYFLLLALLCTAVASFLVVDKVGPTYEATGAVLILPPVTTVQQGSKSDTIGNPYLMLGGLSQIRDIVIRAMTAQATHEQLCQSRADPAYEAMRAELCKPRPGVRYEATQDFTNGAPIILITVEADSTVHVITALAAVMDRVPEILTDLQSGLKLGANAEITSMPLISDRKPETVHKDQIRAGIVAGAGTLGLSLLMIGLFDGLVATRRKRSAQAKPTDLSAVGKDLETKLEAVEWVAETTPSEREAVERVVETKLEAVQPVVETNPTELAAIERGPATMPTEPAAIEREPATKPAITPDSESEHVSALAPTVPNFEPWPLLGPYPQQELMKEPEQVATPEQLGALSGARVARG
jgi:hypothetical protein